MLSFFRPLGNRQTRSKAHAIIVTPQPALISLASASKQATKSPNMMKEIIESLPLAPFETPENEKERFGGGKNNASKDGIAIPSDIVVKASSGIPQNCSSHSRTLATMTETFTASEDFDDSTLMSSSLAFIDSFEVHNQNLLDFDAHTQTEEEEEGVEHEIGSVLKAKFDVGDQNDNVDDPEQAQSDSRRTNANSYVRARYNPPPARQLPFVPSSLYTSGSSDSWGNQYVNNRDVSLFDAIDSRDEEEEDRGHDGDDERTVGLDDMKRMTQKYQQSVDSILPVKHDDAFEGPIPKFSQGPLSHLRDDNTASLRDIFQPNFSTSSSTSLATTPSNGRTTWEHFKAVELSEEKKRKEREEKSIMETKGMLDSLKELIYCIPRSGGD